MSQDLLAAFGEEPQAAGNARDISYNDQPVVQARSRLADDIRFAEYSIPDDVARQEEADDFGDFVDASGSPPTDSPNRRQYGGSGSSDRPGSSFISQTSGKRPTGAQSSAVASKPQRPNPAPVREQPGTQRHPFADHMDILFDAGDNEYDAGVDELADLSTNPEAAMAYSKKLIAEQEAASAKQKQSFAHKSFDNRTTDWNSRTKAGGALRVDSHKSSSPIGPDKGKMVDVLFDIDDVELSANSDSDGNWGDFEDGPVQLDNAKHNASTTTHTKQVQVDTLASSVPAVINTDSQAQEQPKASQALSTAQDQSQSTASASSANEEWLQDEWDDFKAVVPALPAPKIAENQLSAASVHGKFSSSEDKLPPTNVPPPAILFSLFPSVFAAANEVLFDSLTRLRSSEKQTLLAHPASRQFLSGYLEKCIVLAYLLAGRKLRWKRDQRLAQSMRIGPAAGGGKGGMKLVGLDKSESAREDRETVEIVRLYRTQMGKLQTAVTISNNGPSVVPAQKKLGRVPNITENMMVKTLTPANGGITATRACALCGLKRNERVANTDYDVEDSFGEWWIPRLDMHVLCHQFWEHEERKLSGK